MSGGLLSLHLARSENNKSVDSLAALEPELGSAAQERRPRCGSFAALSIPAHGFVDLLAIAPLVRRERHHRIMNIAVDHQHAFGRLCRPFPPQIKSVFHETTL